MTDLPDEPVITVFGASLVGCYVGGILASRGNDVKFFGRENPGIQATRYGMAFSSHNKPLRIIAGENIRWDCDA
ncbi:MAG: hypothetical protein GY761_11745 [Hyphomicrobiales bacterium]|nr:hypothetical protein [Hyphomicrobiales bacterium]